MFFAASKVLAFFATPSNILISLVVLGAILLFTRWARAGRGLIVGAVTLIVLLGLLPVGPMLIGVLESRFLPWDASRGAPTGFIILGGALDPETSRDRGTPALGDAAERVTIIAELARRYPAAKLIYSSGNAALFGGPAEVDYVLPLLDSFGIDRSRIVLESRSRNTAENAELSKALANPKEGERWVIVTSAAHMPRSIGVFRAAGFDVEAFPVDWRTRRDATFQISRSFVDGLKAIDNAAHEFVGLLVYRITGRSSEIFPGPR